MWEVVIKFSVNKSDILAFKCHVSPGRLFIKVLLILTIHYVKDPGSQYFYSFNFHDQAVCRIANENRANCFTVKTFRP